MSTSYPSELEGAVVANLRRKEQDYSAMLGRMAEHMRDLVRDSVFARAPKADPYKPTTPMRLPPWMR